ncbi:glutathione S-transferase family protein [Ideonella sp. B7]|uniref:glutathione S-transferase family protein n=1 Tax=Ideonella benzenivorans TaxID=2831643 RepID=UPI001CEDF706|nr:glutathione S-transferase family protein [Ideonella benzenivorans]MCA6216780.1 glutathione S-transferase family protein [Ideonella benzenivorans]
MPLTEAADCELVLYTHPWSRGQIARWMLEEVGVPYRQVLLEFGTTMKAPDYLALNPMGKVPTLVHRGRVVTECAAICAYLADAFPAAGLAPAPAERAAYYRWLFFAAGPLEAAVIDRAMRVEITPKEEVMVGYGSYERALDVVAGAVSAGPYVAGPDFSAADVYVGSHLIWGMQFDTIPKRPEFEAYAARLKSRPAYKAARAIDQALGQALQPQA